MGGRSLFKIPGPALLLYAAFCSAPNVHMPGVAPRGALSLSPPSVEASSTCARCSPSKRNPLSTGTCRHVPGPHSSSWELAQTREGSKRQDGRSRPKTSLLVVLEILRTLALEKTMPGIYTQRAGGAGVGIRQKDTRGKPPGGANSGMRFEGSFSYLPCQSTTVPPYGSWFHITFSITGRQQEKQGICIPTTSDSLEREPPFPKMGICGGRVGGAGEGTLSSPPLASEGLSHFPPELLGSQGSEERRNFSSTNQNRCFARPLASTTASPFPHRASSGWLPGAQAGKEAPLPSKCT